MNKVGRLFNWGLGTFQIVMRNKLVAIGCFLVTGLFHTFSPVGSLDWDTMMLSLLLMLYAAVSIVFVLSNKNKTIGKGKDVAGNLVKGYFEGQRDNSAKGQKLLSKNKNMSEHTNASNKQLDERVGKLKEKQVNASPGKIALLITYILLLAFGIVIFIWRENFVNIVQIIFGGLLVADGISNIVTVTAAYKSDLTMKGKVFSLILGVLTIVLGVVFIILPRGSAPLIYQITGIMLIVKAISEYIVMIRNREIISSVKESIDQIKEL